MTIGEKCKIPPEGWYCTRPSDHEGPCAALPEVTVENPDEIVGKFEITRKQSTQARVWMDHHNNTKHKKEFKDGQRYAGAIGGAFTWQFTGTSLGEITTLHCICGEEINLTDWDNFG